MRAFFDSVRASFGPLSQDQVDGFNVLVPAVKDLPVMHAAYILATAWHETARTMQPVKEAYWKGEDWRKANLRYFPWYGRGYVQLTWATNYRKAGAAIGVDLIADPDRAMVPANAAKIIVRGMTEGWFTGKKMADYNDYVDMRRVVNGTDKASVIAGYAKAFEKALLAQAKADLPVSMPDTSPMNAPLVKVLAALVAASAAVAAAIAALQNYLQGN